MKRRSRYPDKVIAFALTERARGTPWKKIAADIRAEFDIRSPSERQMRDWYKEWGAGPSDPEMLMRQTLINTVRAATPAAAFATQRIAVEQGVPALIQAWQQGKDPRIAGGVMILSILEQQVGSEIYDKVVSEYQRIREHRPEGKITGLLNQITSEPPVRDNFVGK